MAIKEITPDKPVSSDAVIKILREYLNRSFTEKITYLEITVTINGNEESRNISCHTLKINQ